MSSFPSMLHVRRFRNPNVYDFSGDGTFKRRILSHNVVRDTPRSSAASCIWPFVCCRALTIWRRSALSLTSESLATLAGAASVTILRSGNKSEGMIHSDRLKFVAVTTRLLSSLTLPGQSWASNSFHPRALTLATMPTSKTVQKRSKVHGNKSKSETVTMMSYMSISLDICI